MFSPSELSYAYNALNSDARIDGRQLQKFRPVQISRAVLLQANGSARLCCDGTEILVGVRLDTNDSHKGELEVVVDV